MQEFYFFCRIYYIERKKNLKFKVNMIKYKIKKEG
jgi:hypothetical protein